MQHSDILSRVLYHSAIQAPLKVKTSIGRYQTLDSTIAGNNEATVAPPSLVYKVILGPQKHRDSAVSLVVVPCLSLNNFLAFVKRKSTLVLLVPPSTEELQGYLQKFGPKYYFPATLNQTCGQSYKASTIENMTLELYLTWKYLILQL